MDWRGVALATMGTLKNNGLSRPKIDLHKKERRPHYDNPKTLFSPYSKQQNNLSSRRLHTGNNKPYYLILLSFSQLSAGKISKKPRALASNLLVYDALFGL